MHSAKIARSVEIKVCTSTWSQCDQNEIKKELKTKPITCNTTRNQFGLGL